MHSLINTPHSGGPEEGVPQVQTVYVLNDIPYQSNTHLMYDIPAFVKQDGVSVVIIAFLAMTYSHSDSAIR